MERDPHGLLGDSVELPAELSDYGPQGPQGNVGPQREDPFQGVFKLHDFGPRGQRIPAKDPFQWLLKVRISKEPHPSVGSLEADPGDAHQEAHQEAH